MMALFQRFATVLFSFVLLSSQRRALFAALLLSLALGIGAPPAAQAQHVMKLATATINDSQHEWMRIFAAKVEKASGGKIKVELYPGGQLGSIPRMIESTQFNSVQGFIGPPEFMSGIDTRFELPTVPGLFRDTAHFQRTMDDPTFRAALFEAGQQKGLKAIGLFVTGPLALVARRPVEKLNDLKGLKLRILASPLQIEQVKRLGATGVPMSLGDVMPAVQQGTIDGAFGVIPVFNSLKFFGSAPYALETGQAYLGVITVVSKIWFDGLPKDLQQVLVDAGKTTGDEVSVWAADYYAREQKSWVANGGKLVTLSEAERKPLLEAMAPIGPEVMKARRESQPLYELMLKTAKANE